MEYFNARFITQQVFWKPAFNVVQFYFLNAPKWAGGYGGLPSIDVCSMITGVSTNILVNSAPDLCEGSIASLVNGYATLLIKVLLVLSVREIVPLVRHTIPAYYARIDNLKKEQEKKERNQQASAKNAETRGFNLAIASFSKTVITVLRSDGDDAEKVKLLLGAYKSLNPKHKMRLGEAETLIETADDCLMLK